jgi:hypothetical protein
MTGFTLLNPSYVLATPAFAVNTTKFGPIGVSSLTPPGDAFDESHEQYRLRRATFWFAVAAVLASVAIFAVTILIIIVRIQPWPLVEAHFPAMIGLPGAAVVAFVLVVFLRQTEGPIEFEGLGFKIKGAAGQVIMWVICFLAITGAIKLLW